MNVFKLLSRTSKTPQSSPAQKLPSSGAAVNPQLFGQDEPTTHLPILIPSRKRKRGRDSAEEVINYTELPADLDFFNARNTKMQIGGRQSGSIQNEKPDEQENGADYKPIAGEDLVEESTYSIDECKSILHSHKLKITLLEDFAPIKKLRKEKEKSKTHKEDTEGQRKNVKAQLYPQPLTAFSQVRGRYGISRRLAQNIAEQGYRVPTEVQLGSLPLLLSRGGEMEGHSRREVESSGVQYSGNIDLMTVAPTGSGKTIAFLVPILNTLLAEGKTIESRAGPRAIVLAPTRELASQIVNEAQKLAKGIGLKASLMRKGMEVVDRSQTLLDEEEALSRGDTESEVDDLLDDGQSRKPRQRKTKRAERVKAAILVATPLALLNALKMKHDEVATLPNVTRLVLDEADVLLDPLFREQTLAIWTACNNPSLRVGLWSATMGSNIESLAMSTINDRWSALEESALDPLPPRAPVIRLVVGLKDSAVPNISHQLTYAATEAGKLIGMRQLLHPSSLPANTSHQPTLRPPFLVFTQTIPRAIALHSELLYDIPPEAGGSTRIAVLHADLTSTARDAIMTRFRQGEIWVLITTDLLARGVDFRGLNGVVNYDVPSSTAAYVHRVGRTGRAGRQGGVAVTLYAQEDIPHVKLIANAIRASEKLRGVSAEEGSVKQWLLDALPTPTKREKQMLKKRGVEARRAVKDDKGKTKNRISTKSGYVRRVENNRRGAKMAAQRREALERREGDDGGSSGFEEFEV